MNTYHVYYTLYRDGIYIGCGESYMKNESLNKENIEKWRQWIINKSHSSDPESYVNSVHICSITKLDN